MKEKERMVAGLRCTEVLAKLSSYLDGDLNAGERTAIEEHVRGCDWCTKFGEEFVSVVEGLKKSLQQPEPVDEGVEAMILHRLRALP